MRGFGFCRDFLYIRISFFLDTLKRKQKRKQKPKQKCLNEF